MRRHAIDPMGRVMRRHVVDRVMGRAHALCCPDLHERERGREGEGESERARERGREGGREGGRERARESARARESERERESFIREQCP